MIMEAAGSELPKEALTDPFRPPDEPVPVFCLHCRQEYSSDQIVWREEGGQGFWCCPIEGCDGKGFTFDIHPADGSGWTEDEDWDEDEDPAADAGPVDFPPPKDWTGDTDSDEEIPF